MNVREDNFGLSDIQFVKGLIEKNARVEKQFYEYCKTYFDVHYKSVFFTNDTDKEDIFQNSFISLWQNIEYGKIYIEDGILKGRNNKRLECSLTTYLMSIAKLKYLEFVRSKDSCSCLSEIPKEDISSCSNSLIADWLEDDYEKAMFEVISDCISVMPPKCSRILTKFYYENKKLDDMLVEIPEYSSKDALKSNKNRCLNRLKTYAQQLYKIRKSK